MICYVINLDRIPSRYEHFLKQVDGGELQVVRVSAVDGLQLSDAEIEYWQKRSRVWSPLTDAEIACFLSHRKTWGMIVESGAAWAFVAEDDIHVSQDFHTFLRQSDWLPTQTDLVKAETSGARVEMALSNPGRAYGHKLRRLISVHTGSGGYFISRKGAVTLLKMTDEICEPVDRLLFAPDIPVSGRLNAYQLDPAICIQDYYINKQNKRDGFESHIPSGGPGPSPGMAKRKGLAKLRHELVRPLLQLKDRLRSVLRLVTFTSVSKSVTIRLGGASRPSQSLSFPCWLIN